MNLSEEVWKPIKGFDEFYEISNLGRVKSFYSKKEKILKPIKDKDGYLQVKIYKNKKQYTAKIHRLVAKMFLLNSENFPEVNHKDENKENNCVNNLEWCDHAYNNNYGSKIEKNLAKSKKVNQYDLNGNFIKTWKSMRFASNELKISNHIKECCEGKFKSCGGYKWKFYSKEEMSQVITLNPKG